MYVRLQILLATRRPYNVTLNSGTSIYRNATGRNTRKPPRAKEEPGKEDPLEWRRLMKVYFKHWHYVAQLLYERIIEGLMGIKFIGCLTDIRMKYLHLWKIRRCKDAHITMHILDAKMNSSRVLCKISMQSMRSLSKRIYFCLTLAVIY